MRARCASKCVSNIRDTCCASTFKKVYLKAYIFYVNELTIFFKEFKSGRQSVGLYVCTYGSTDYIYVKAPNRCFHLF